MTYGLKNVTVKHAENVLNSVEAIDFVMNLPQGLDTELREGGSNLSAGQLQRLSLARAILRRPKIVFLDEATSNLPSDTETRILANIRKELPETTLVVVTHRPSVLKLTDKIISIDRGRLSSITDWNRIDKDESFSWIMMQNKDED